MTIHVAGKFGKPPPNPPNTFAGEVFVDNDGHYIGDFSEGMNATSEAPLGWAHGTTATLYGFFDCGGSPVGGLVALLATYWNSPQCGDVANLPFAFPTYKGTIVTDNSGPPGLESEKACKIDFPGTPGNFSWVGETASNIAGSSAYTGGWTPTNGEAWIFSGWFRSIPDANGFDCSGFSCGFSYAQYGYPPITVSTFTINDAWQFFSCEFNWVYATGGLGIPCISGLDGGFNFSQERTDVTVPPFIIHFDLTKAYPTYSFLAKHVHLYPANSPSISGPKHIRTKI